MPGSAWGGGQLVVLASALFNPGPTLVAVASTAWEEGLVEEARPAPGLRITGDWWHGIVDLVISHCKRW